MSRPLANWHTRHKEQLTTGQRAADWMRNGMGSLSFIGIFVAVHAGESREWVKPPRGGLLSVVLGGRGSGSGIRPAIESKGLRVPDSRQ